MSTTSKLAMNRKIVPMNALGTVALAIVLCGVCQSQAQGPKTPYPNMAPIEQYLMDRNAEIALARSAAPESISRDAEVSVLGRHGYETAVKGKNGFVCVVERSWMSPFDDPQFWNPKLRGPNCFNPPAARSILPLTYKRTELVLAGLSKAQIIDGMKAFDKKELPPLEPGGMCYMMSSKGYLNDSAGHWVPHLMFYVSTNRRSGLGRGSARLSGYVESTISGRSGASDCVHDSGAQVVGRNGRTHGCALSANVRSISAEWLSARKELLTKEKMQPYAKENHDGNGKGKSMNFTQAPDIVTWPETHYVFVEKIGPFQSTAPQAWKDLHQRVPSISEHNKITGYMSLYKVGPKVYRAGVSLAAGPNDLPEGLQSTKIKGGKYSRFVLTGPYSGLPEACGRVFEIVAETKIGLRDDYCIENYVNDPRTTPEQQLITEILIPTV